MTSDLSATLERVRAALECHPYGRLVCYAGDHVLSIADLRALLAHVEGLAEEREPETVPLSVALQAVHLALNASRDVQARDHAVRAFQDKYGSLWPDGTLLFRDAARARDGGTA